MKKLKLLLAIILVGVGVALTYHVFESLVHEAIDLVWYDWLDTDNNRLLVVPLTLVLSLVFFGAQHVLDQNAESSDESDLGGMPKPKVANYLKVLLIGFLSLIAGASLGPEAVLVPACMILGAVVGTRLSKDTKVVSLMAAAGIMALFTGFFHSALVGILSVFLVTKQSKTKLSPILLLTAVISSTSAYLTLKLVDGAQYFSLPDYNWQVSLATVALSLGLVAAGYLAILAMGHLSDLAKSVRSTFQKRRNGWLLNALVASLGLGTLYLLGGPLVEFTGNRSIIPMFNEAESIGLAGLMWILIIKISVIAWSKSMGYRGGVIFPTVFLAAVLVAIAQLYVEDVNMIYGLIAVLVGAFVADRKTHILF